MRWPLQCDVEYLALQQAEEEQKVACMIGTGRAASELARATSRFASQRVGVFPPLQHECDHVLALPRLDGSNRWDVRGAGIFTNSAGECTFSLPPAPPQPLSFEHLRWRVAFRRPALQTRYACRQGKPPHLRTEGSRQPRANIDGHESNGA